MTRRCRGMTLLELLVVACVSSVLIVGISSTWMWVGHSTGELQATDALVRELKLVTESLSQDLGASVGIRSLQPDAIQFDIDGLPMNDTADWGGSDTIIEYTISSGKLMRLDRTAGTSSCIADHVTSLSVSSSAGILEVTLNATLRRVDRTLHLQFRYP